MDTPETPFVSQEVAQAAASTRSEADALRLRELKLAADAARLAFHGHKKPEGLTIDEEITWDIAERVLCRACAEAARAYEGELDRQFPPARDVLERVGNGLGLR